MRRQTIIGWMLAMVFAGEMQAQTFTPSETASLKKNARPTASDIQREMQQVERERKAMFKADEPTIRNGVSPFPKVPTPVRTEIDIETIARQYEQKVAARKQNALIIFASLTMPKASLKRLLRQAHRIGAPVMLRGFKNHSFKQTALAIKALGEPSAQILIHPEAFTQYHIRAVPTVVLTQDNPINPMNDPARALPHEFVSIAGDVSLDYALDEIARRAPQFAPKAARALRRLRGKPQ